MEGGLMGTVRRLMAMIHTVRAVLALALALCAVAVLAGPKSDWVDDSDILPAFPDVWEPASPPIPQAVEQHRELGVLHHQPRPNPIILRPSPTDAIE
jgi:hypothetical protein